jgi:hypothetical protein
VPYVIGFVFVLVALYFALWVVVAAFMWLLLPAFLIAVPGAAVLGALAAAVTAVVTLIGHRNAPKTVTPDDVVSGSGRLPKLRGDGRFGRDRAWPTYFSAQGRVDLAKVWQAITDLLGEGWRRIGRVLKGHWPGRIAVLVFACPLWLGVSAGALFASAVIMVACGLVLLVLWACWALFAGVLRAGDQLIRKVRKASGSCQSCYYVTALPTFACPGCGRLHRDVRPGRLGGAWRRCGCGTVLPTTVLRVARRIPPRCPRCDEKLRSGAAVVTDIRVPVFGPVSAGKTRLVYAGLLALRDGVTPNGGTVDFVDDESRQSFDHAVALIGAGGDTAKTPAGELPRAITIRYTAGRRRALLHLFDAAGEFYADRDDNTDLEFLDHAQGLVFVVDPFSVPWVRDQIGDSASAIVAKANPALEDPERVYHVTVERLRDYGVVTRKRRLAVAVVKADLLATIPLGEGLSPEHVREWLVEAALDNLVLSAERDFGEVRYFVVASMPGIPAGEVRSPAGPLAWIAAGAGLELWPDRAAGAHSPEPHKPEEKEAEEAL